MRVMVGVWLCVCARVCVCVCDACVCGVSVCVASPPRVKNDPSLFKRVCFIYAGVSNVDGYERNAKYNLNCLLQTSCHLTTRE